MNRIVKDLRVMMKYLISSDFLWRISSCKDIKLEGPLCFVKIMIIITSCSDCLIKNFAKCILISTQGHMQCSTLKHMQISRRSDLGIGKLLPP